MDDIDPWSHYVHLMQRSPTTLSKGAPVSYSDPIFAYLFARAGPYHRHLVYHDLLREMCLETWADGIGLPFKHWHPQSFWSTPINQLLFLLHPSWVHLLDRRGLLNLARPHLHRLNMDMDILQWRALLYHLSQFPSSDLTIEYILRAFLIPSSYIDPTLPDSVYHYAAYDKNLVHLTSGFVQEAIYNDNSNVSRILELSVDSVHELRHDMNDVMLTLIRHDCASLVRVAILAGYDFKLLFYFPLAYMIRLKRIELLEDTLARVDLPLVVRRALSMYAFQCGQRHVSQCIQRTTARRQSMDQAMTPLIGKRDMSSSPVSPHLPLLEASHSYTLQTYVSGGGGGGARLRTQSNCGDIGPLLTPSTFRRLESSLLENDVADDLSDTESQAIYTPPPDAGRLRPNTTLRLIDRVHAMVDSDRISLYAQDVMDDVLTCDTDQTSCWDRSVEGFTDRWDRYYQQTCQAQV